MTGTYFRQLALRAADLLGDGEWHDREMIMRELMRMIPPGVALRRADHDRESLWLRQHPGETVVPPRIRNADAESRIRIGARAIVSDHLVPPLYELQGPARKRTHVRLAGRHRETRRQPERARIMDLESEVERLHGELAALREQQSYEIVPVRTRHPDAYELRDLRDDTRWRIVIGSGVWKRVDG